MKPRPLLVALFFIACVGACLRAQVAGVDVGRLMRTQFLGFSMPRNMARGRSVELDADEVDALCAGVDYAGLAGSWQSNEPPVTPRAAGPRRKR